jgi:hypothetical protein
MRGEATGRGLTPAEIGRLTIPQLLCLVDERPPGEAAPITSVNDWEAYQAEREAARRRWRGED